MLDLDFSPTSASSEFNPPRNETERDTREFIAGELRNSWLRGPGSAEHSIAKIDAVLAGWNDGQIWAALQPVLHDGRIAMLGKVRCSAERGDAMLDYWMTQASLAGCTHAQVQAEVEAGERNRVLCFQAALEDRPLELVPYGQY